MTCLEARAPKPHLPDPCGVPAAANYCRAAFAARRRGTSVSKMIAGYFRLLDSRDEDPTDSLPPTVRSLKGCMRRADVGREDYHRHLEEKYL